MPNFNDLSIYLKVNYAFSNIQFVIGIIGLISNILVICVFSRKSLRKYSYTFYCRTKAASDIIVLLFTFRNWANFIMDANLDVVSPFFCILNQFFPYSWGCFSLIVLGIISIDRFLIVIYPNRFKLIKEKWFQLALLLLVFIWSFFRFL